MLELKPIGYILALWFLGLLIIFLTGFALNTITSRRIKQYQIQSTDKNDSNERFILGAYGILIIFASIYFYISIPMLILATGVLILIFGFYGLYLLVLLTSVVGFSTLLSLVLGMFKRVETPYPGYELKRESAPRLWAFVDSIASQIGSKQVNAIYITPWLQIVMDERGTVWGKMQGKSQRCLVLGLGAITGLHQDGFRTIIASLLHLLSNRSVNILLALHLQESVHKTIDRFRSDTFVTMLNPIVLLIYIYHRFFLRTDSIVRRMEQLLSHRFAATIYGLTSPLDALIETESHEIYFNMKVVDELKRAYFQGDKLENVYRLLSSSTTKQKEQMKAELIRVVQSPDFLYRDFQPFLDRLALLIKDNGLASNQPTVLDLIPNFEALQVEMTKIIAAEAF